jgi:hypothetical protein
MASIQQVLGADGISRKPKEEEELNQIMAATFRGRAGRKAIEYLRSITIEYVAGPNISDTELRHREGMRYLVGIIETRINKGQSNE